MEEKLGGKVHYKHAVRARISEYASYLLNMLEVSHDGRTAYERSKGKRAKVAGLEFGERLLWKRRPAGGGMGKLQCLGEDGSFFLV